MHAFSVAMKYIMLLRISKDLGRLIGRNVRREAAEGAANVPEGQLRLGDLRAPLCPLRPHCKESFGAELLRHKKNDFKNLFATAIAANLGTQSSRRSRKGRS